MTRSSRSGALEANFSGVGDRITADDVIVYSRWSRWDPVGVLWVALPVYYFSLVLGAADVGRRGTGEKLRRNIGGRLEVALSICPVIYDVCLYHKDGAID
jgi:hypothetical protein